MKLRQIWILIQATTIILTTLFVLFVPAMFCVGWFLINVIAINGLFLEALVLFPIFTFGALFICMAIAMRVTLYYNELFEWEKKYRFMSL